MNQPEAGADSNPHAVNRANGVLLTYDALTDMYEVSRGDTLILHTPQRAQADYAFMLASEGANWSDPEGALTWVQRGSAHRLCSACGARSFRAEHDAAGRCVRCQP